ncbi:ABC transporter permease [Acidithrix ferrooxidans]|uniref:Bicarbonate transport system permease protein CmpB n=1 Tax=Acidithrix ferrooxidans TaxID=1280514 RepID=A0A0D8HEW4_9ACTN|nr:ABC transporter permease [Acidithrix ferrooxidans]KJF16409.1 bicarbonate transport system permease protein CmpB [Acidithrix ferrooxidans]
MNQVRFAPDQSERPLELTRARLTPRQRRTVRQIGGILVALALWELSSATGAVNSNALVTPLATFGGIISHMTALATALVATLEAWALGISVAVVAGILIGTLVGRSQIADAATETIVRMMRPLPSLALIPIAILIAGLGVRMTAGLVSFAAFWPVFINTRVGVRQVDNTVLETAAVLGLKKLNLLYRVVLPSASPMIASGIQVAISLALVVTVSVELVGGTGGLGEFILLAQQGNEPSVMFGGIIMGGLLGWGISRLFAWIIDRFIPWRTQGIRTNA